MQTVKFSIVENALLLVEKPTREVLDDIRSAVIQSGAIIHGYCILYANSTELEKLMLLLTTNYEIILR